MNTGMTQNDVFTSLKECVGNVGSFRGHKRITAMVAVFCRTDGIRSATVGATRDGAAGIQLLSGRCLSRSKPPFRPLDLTLGEVRVGERKRVARELHDTLLQSFPVLLLRLQTADGGSHAGSW